jgi:sarcosine oxidase
MIYDVIVLGTGGVGSAAAFHLARRGCRVLGLDRYPGGHDQGSSHGHTRIIRMAYFEHSDYVPLLRRAYELWHELEQLVDQQLYHEVGLLQIGPPVGVVVPGVLSSAQKHNLPIELLDAGAMHSQFPGFVMRADQAAVFERRAGFLFVEKCVLAHLAQASQAGAELRIGESVVSWKSEPQQVVVQTDRNTYYAKHLVVTAGAWAGKLLADLGVHFEIRRKHLHWYRTNQPEYRIEHPCPTFFYEAAGGYFYGFPALDARGVKVAEHSGGTVIDDPRGDDRSVDVVDRQRVESFLGQYMPGVSHEPTDHVVCYYTMSPDEQFIIDRHPHQPNVCFTAGLSGHGFKFTSVLGEIMADLTLNGASPLPIEFLNCQRFRPLAPIHLPN